MENENITSPELVKQSPDIPLRTLAELEAIIKPHLHAWQVVAAALDEIHRRRLYKSMYGTWENYLKDRWGMSPAHGYRLLKAHQKTKSLPPGEIPESERAANGRRDKPKRPEPPAESQSESKIIIDLDLEFVRFMATVDRWKVALAKDDYRKLVERAESYIEDIAIELENEEVAA